MRALVADKVVRSVASEEKLGKKQKRDRKEKETSSDSDGKSDIQKQDRKNGKLKAKQDDGDDELVRNGSFNFKNEEKLIRLRKSGKLYSLGDYPGIPSSDLLQKIITGIVTNYVSWKEFWIQKNSDVAEDIHQKLNQGDLSEIHGKVVKSIEEGECCIVQFEDAWFRGTVLEKFTGGSHGSQVKVLLVDKGISTILPLNEVRDGDFTLYDIPPTVLKCKLDNKIDNLQDIIQSSEGKLGVKLKDFKENIFVVSLRNSKDKSHKDRQNVVVVHVESVEKVWVVDKETMPKLDDLRQQLSELDPVPVKNPELDKFYCVRFSQDECLYRASIIEFYDENEVLVHYVDFGNSEIVSNDDIYELPEDLKSMEAAAKPVHIKFSSLALDTERCRNKLEKALSGDKVSASIDSDQIGTFWIGANLLKLKAAFCIYNKEDDINIFHQAESPRVDVTVSHVDGDCVWLRIADFELGVRLETKVQELAKKQGKAGKVNVGDWVIARYSQDRRYYRARVVQKLSNHRVEVIFIDHGNLEQVDSGWLKSLPCELKLCPGLAMRCHVDNDDTCFMVSPGHLMSLGHVTVDLVKPLDHQIRQGCIEDSFNYLSTFCTE